MINHPDRAPLMRLAATLPVGSSERRTILATIKKLAGTMDDTLARADLVSGALNKSKTADRGPVFKAMQDGVGDFLTEFNNWATDKISEYGVSDLGTLRESDLSEDDEAELKVFDQRLKGYGAIAPKLLGLLGEVGEGDENAYEVLTNRRDYKLRESVQFGAAKGIHGMVQTMDSGRRQVTDIGRGGISTPGSMGVDAEDLTQVMLGGGMMMPGMIFDMNMSDKTDIGGGVKIRGKFKDRKKAWCPAGTSIYTISGAARGPLIKPAANYARTVAMNAAVDWKRSVHVELEYILTPADEGDLDTQAINMGAKLNLESLLGAELIDGVAVSKQLILARYYIKKIKNQMNRMLKPGVAKATWQAVVAMIEDKQSPWKTGGGEDFAVNVPKVIKFLEDSREGQQIMQENGLESMDKRVMQARWKDAVKSLKRQLAQLSDDELLTSYHLTLEGMVDDVPEYIKKIKQDQDLYKTYLSDMRKTASEQKQANPEKTAMRTVTASERSAMIRLAATLPVGSPERRALIAGCEKLPNKAMQENCEKSKKDGVQPGKGKSKAKSDDKKKDDGKMPAELLEKFKAKKAADRTWADFNTALAKLMKGLKRDVGATKIKQNGKNSAGNRNIWVTLPNRGTVDVWVEDGQTQLWKLLRGGQSGWGPVIPYGDQTPEQVYKKMVAGLKDIVKKAAGKTAASLKSLEADLVKAMGEAGLGPKDQMGLKGRTMWLADGKGEVLIYETSDRGVVLNHKGKEYKTVKDLTKSSLKMAGDVPAELKKHQFTSEDNPNPKGNDKDGDGKSGEPSPLKGKKADHHEESKEKYPWDECIEQQTKAYSAEAAPKICGKIRAESQGRSASPKAALIRLAATLPVGSQERKTIIRMASGS